MLASGPFWFGWTAERGKHQKSIRQNHIVTCYAHVGAWTKETISEAELPFSGPSPKWNLASTWPPFKGNIGNPAPISERHTILRRLSSFEHRTISHVRGGAEAEGQAKAEAAARAMEARKP